MITPDRARVLSVIADLLTRVFTTVRISAPGWASTSLLGSIRSVVLLSAVGWQAVMIATTAMTLGTSGFALMAGMAIFALLALGARRRLVPDLAIPVLMAVLGIWCYVLAPDVESPLTLAACWQIDFATCFAGLLIMDRRIIPVVIGYAAAATAVVLTMRPDWSLQFAVSIVVTQTAIIIALRLGLPALMRIGTDADTAAIRAEDAVRRAAIARESSTRIAEESRVLHDTAINTLGAIANGGAGITDAARVREQCERDIHSLAALRTDRPLPGPTSVRDVFGQPGLPTRRSGLSDELIEQLDVLLPRPVIAALVGCVREAVTNATKHSGAEGIDIDTAIVGDEVVITVSDDGVGFDPAAAHSRQRGLANSIMARAEDAGIRVDIRSAAGAGTRITLTTPLNARATVDIVLPSTDIGGFLAATRQRAAEMWALGVTVIGVILTVIGATNTYGALYLMVSVMLLAWLAFRWRLLHRWPTLLAAFLVACTMLVLFLAAAATGFGSVGVVHWQALAPTGAMIMFFALLPSLRAIVTGVASLVVTIGVLAGVVATTNPIAAQNVLVAGCATLGFVIVWARFQTLVERIGVRSLHSRQDAFAADLASDIAAAAQAHYLRWMDAGLEQAITLLGEIADGTRRPEDEDTRRHCAEEERYLRQLVQISPELIHLGREMMPTLQFARERGVSFTLRLGSTDTPDEDAARLLSTMVLHNLSTTPAGASVLASVFPTRDGLQLTLVGPTLSLPPSPSPWPTHATVSHGLIEMVTRESDRDLTGSPTGGW